MAVNPPARTKEFWGFLAAGSVVGLLVLAAVTLPVPPSDSCGGGPPCSWIAIGGTTLTMANGVYAYNFTIAYARSVTLADIGFEVRSPTGRITPFAGICVEAPNGATVGSYNGSWASTGAGGRCGPLTVQAPGNSVLVTGDFLLLYSQQDLNGYYLTALGEGPYSGTTSGSITD